MGDFCKITDSADKAPNHKVARKLSHDLTADISTTTAIRRKKIQKTEQKGIESNPSVVDNRKESGRITEGHPSGKAKVKTSSLLSRIG
ncbi:hypothetical protein PGTUg99_023302 [Puccinia graminis f. sp. tritici]|uniref:Uncharacterized protein n=1 Tax=Puccinia graminis f. sp. tritici TaxID=56615 RepID=A0A5B0NIE9_PUCGR|nr:hypothetical protein PGTUg99_023302 [Puccinia graminis f. sp. tritici]